MGVISYYTAISKEQLRRFLSDPDSLQKFHEEDRSFIDIDKAHQGIECLLNRASSESARPAVGKAVYGGTDTAVMAAYGPVRYLTSEEVIEIDKALSLISTDDLRAVYSSQALCAIDSDTSWLWNDPEQALGYLLPYYEKLASFYHTAAGENKAVLQSET